MKKAIVFGASEASIESYKNIEEDYNIVALTDNNESKWGGRDSWL